MLYKYRKYEMEEEREKNRKITYQRDTEIRRGREERRELMSFSLNIREERDREDKEERGREKRESCGKGPL